MTNFVGKLFSKSKEGQKIGGSVPEKKYHCFLICDFFFTKELRDLNLKKEKVITTTKILKFKVSISGRISESI